MVLDLKMYVYSTILSIIVYSIVLYYIVIKPSHRYNLFQKIIPNFVYNNMLSKTTTMEADVQSVKAYMTLTTTYCLGCLEQHIL